MSPELMVRQELTLNLKVEPGASTTCSYAGTRDSLPGLSAWRNLSSEDATPSHARDYRWLTKEGAGYKSNIWNDAGDVAKLYAPGSDVAISEYSYP